MRSQKRSRAWVLIIASVSAACGSPTTDDGSGDGPLVGTSGAGGSSAAAGASGFSGEPSGAWCALTGEQCSGEFAAPEQYCCSARAAGRYDAARDCVVMGREFIGCGLSSALASHEQDCDGGDAHWCYRRINESGVEEVAFVVRTWPTESLEHLGWRDCDEEFGLHVASAKACD